MSDQNNVIRTAHPEHREIAIIRFNREHVRNALGPDDLLLASKHLMDCQYDPTVNAVFLTGTGSAFTSGFDLKILNSLPPEERLVALDTATELMTRIVMMPKIVIAAVNGASAGLGNHIAICSDLCIAQAGSAFHFTGASKGIPSMQFGALLLPMTIGLKKAKALLLRGGQLPAERAEELGICNEVVPPDDWDAAISRLADEFSAKNTAVLAQNKLQMNQNAFNLIGALKLSAMAGSGQLSDASDLKTGRIFAPENHL